MPGRKPAEPDERTPNERWRDDVAKTVTQIMRANKRLLAMAHSRRYSHTDAQGRWLVALMAKEQEAFVQAYIMGEQGGPAAVVVPDEDDW
jgi:hypothetical protein